MQQGGVIYERKLFADDSDDEAEKILAAEYEIDSWKESDTTL